MKKLNALFIVFFLILIITGLATAEIYKWVDEDGVLHISDVPPENVVPNGRVKSMAPSKSGPDVDPHSTRKKATLTQKLLDRFLRKSRNRTSPKVELYTTSWCYYCKEARNFFRSRGIPFTEYDIERDKSAAARKKQLDKRNMVPFAVINGQKISGFSAADYKRALERYP